MGRLLRWPALLQSDRHRSGTVTVDDSGRIVASRAGHRRRRPGLINAGVYMLRRDVLNMIEPDRKVSLEDEVFPALVNRRSFSPGRWSPFHRHRHPESYDAAQTFF